MAREITLSGGGPWGFTLSGGKDFGAPLKVSKVGTVGLEYNIVVLTSRDLLSGLHKLHLFTFID
jgi:hypothetical protein